MHLGQIREDARRASTESLLDRTTIFRREIEGPALDILDAELAARGIGRAELEAHAALREQAGLFCHPDGSVIRCTVCSRPATGRRWKWHRLWGWFVPLFPRIVYLCQEHNDHPPKDPHGRALHYDVNQERRDNATE
jgi:hypothetical protein